MLQDTLEPRWISAFETMLTRCGVQAGDTVAILCESQSRRVLVDLALHAAARLDTRYFTLTVPSVLAPASPPARSTGASDALTGQAAALQALAHSTLVVDCTVEGLMHAPELPTLLQGGTRVVYVSNEHPEALVRLMPDGATEARVKAHTKRMRAAKAMHVTSSAGTNLHIALQGPHGQAVVGGNWGSTTRAGTLTHWPGGLVLGFPAPGSVHGTLVLNTGDVNLTFKRYLERPVTLHIENDHIVRIEGDGVDAELMRSHYSAWAQADGGASAQAVSHVGYGLCEAARWDSMALYDKRDFNGTELRAFAGNFLYSTGANETAGRYTRGHFDLPLRHCTVQLDGSTVVDNGRVVD